jgi:hypothetical protein
VVAEVQALLHADRPADAVLRAYRAAESDVIRAFAIELPAQWTHREFLMRCLRPDMGRIPVLLPRLHSRFEPVRYGASVPPVTAGLVDELTALYADASMRTVRIPSVGATGGPAFPASRTSTTGKGR